MRDSRRTTKSFVGYVNGDILSKQAAEITQLKKQLADETAERKRLEDNEDAMVAYHDELARDLAEADDAIVENCRLCRKYGKAKWTCASMTKTMCALCSTSEQLAKAKARIEARKGKGD
jgi:predicted RNase H-like nuclease (RuvC/YqgF family)